MALSSCLVKWITQAAKQGEEGARLLLLDLSLFLGQKWTSIFFGCFLWTKLFGRYQSLIVQEPPFSKANFPHRNAFPSPSTIALRPIFGCKRLIDYYSAIHSCIDIFTTGWLSFMLTSNQLLQHKNYDIEIGWNLLCEFPSSRFPRWTFLL